MRVSRIVLRVGHHDDGRTLAVQLRKQFHHLAAVLRVEVTRGLVGQDQLGVRHHGTGDGHTLLLSARELLGEVFGTVRNIHAAQDLVDTTLALGRLDAHVDQRQLDVLEDVQFVDQVERLEDEPDIPLAEFRAVFLLEPGDLVAEQRIAARGGIVQKPQDIEQRGLAAARGAHDGDEFTLLHFERHAVQCDGLDLFGTENLLEVLNFQH